MEQSVAGDEGEPAIKINHLSYPLFSLIILSLSIISCKEPVKETPVKKVVADSAVIRQRQLLLIDSIAKAKKANTKKKIYITFDDGPNAGTMNVLNAVVAQQVPVSFFVVAKHTYDSREQRHTWEQLKTTAGIEICNHSYSHAGNRYSRFYNNPQKVIADFNRSDDSLHFQNKVTRMPGRNAWRIDSIIHTDVKESRKAIDSVHLAGFDIMGWDVEWGFDHTSFVPDADTSLLFRRMENLLRDEATKTPGHLVLLAHDQAFRTEEDVQLLKAFLFSLKNNPEYELVLASTYPGIRKK